jgi:hypothetical protein
MTDLRDAARQALKSLRGYRREINCELPCDAERALEAALEQPNADYERGFVDGMSEQAKRSVDRAVNRMADALEQPEQEPVAWLRREELADLQTCNYRRLGADSPRIWAPHQADTPTPEEGLVPVFTHPPHRETEQEPWVKTYSGGKPNYTQRFTLSCGCPSQHGGVPAYWDRDGGTAFGMICEKHWHEYGARSEA